MASNEQRYCVFCDAKVKVPQEPSKVIGYDQIGSDGVFIHEVGVGGCGRRTLTESQTYTMGDAEADDR